MPAPRMTANPKRPLRYRPGKGQDQASESEYETEEERIEQKPKAKVKPAPPPTTSKVTGAFQEVTLGGLKAATAPVINEDEFETDSEDGETAAKSTTNVATAAIAADDDDDESSGEEESEEEDDSTEESSEDEAPAKLLRPMFVRKDQRPNSKTVNSTQSEAALAEEAEARRKEKADALVQEQLERNAILKANEKKAWDDSDDEGLVGKTLDEVDDTDDLDPEAEHAAWKLRELKRVKRSREAIELAEKEREEIERRRNLTKEERDAEDAAHLAVQEEDREGKGKAGYMQRYFHKGAFFQDSAYAEEVGLKGRDIMASRFADQVNNREMLPEFMQIRDMAKLGRKGRTKYKDLKNEDTGRWADFGRSGRRQGEDGLKDGKMDDMVDERFRPDDDSPHHRNGPSGANATAVNASRRRRESPRQDDRRRHRRSRSRSTSPSRRETYTSRSPNDDKRRRSQRSRSRNGRKRSASPGQYRDKRVRVS